MKEREILIGNHEKKDLYLESMKLINKEVKGKQFIKDNFYYLIVKEIYKHVFEEIKEEENMDAYLKAAVNVYGKLHDLNKYFYDEVYDTIDPVLVFYIAGQFLYYFKGRKTFLAENEYSFCAKILERLPGSTTSPLDKDAKMISGNRNKRHVQLNDLIYKKRIENSQLVEGTGLAPEVITELRSGRREITKDILYMMAFAMKITSYELQRFLEEIGEEDEYTTQRDRFLWTVLDDLVRLKTEYNGLNAVEVANAQLVSAEPAYQPLSPAAKKKKTDSNVRTVLITGGLGFIGRNCIDFFNNLSKKKTGIKYRLCILMREKPDYELPDNVVGYYGKVESKLIYERILLENHVDYIIHLAAVSIVGVGKQDIEATYRVNAQITNTICGVIQDNQIKIKGMIFPSTGLVYGGCIDGGEPYREKSLIDKQKLKDPYTSSKYATELLLENHAQAGIPVIIARLSNIYGAYDKSDRLIPSVIRRLDNGGIPELYVDAISGEPAQKDFLYAEDLAEAFFRIIQCFEDPNYVDNKKDIIFNIGSGKMHSTEEVILKLIEIMGKDVKMEKIRCNLTGGNKRFSVEKAKCELGFEAKTSLEEGLRKTVEWYLDSKQKYQQHKPDQCDE